MDLFLVCKHPNFLYTAIDGTTFNMADVKGKASF